MNNTNKSIQFFYLTKTKLKKITLTWYLYSHGKLVNGSLRKNQVCNLVLGTYPAKQSSILITVLRNTTIDMGWSNIIVVLLFI